MPEKEEQKKEAGIPAFGASGRRVGDYLLGQMIGAGGMGSVFLAKQISMQRLVAVKILRADYSSDPVYMERFFQEVRLLAKLENPYIIQAIEAGVDQWTCYFAMEYVDGRDLRTELAIQERLPEKEVLLTARDIARAMAYAWNKYRMIHRDIKPANIMRTRTGMTKLLDLGISKIVSTTGSHSELTASGLIIGSPVYVSPEQARGSQDIDFRSDIYSLGITMYHLLAGRPPYDSKNPMEVVAMHLTNPIPILRKDFSVTPGTSALIREMMSKDPGGRPGSWEEIERRTVKLLGQFDTVPSPLPGGGKGSSGKKGFRIPLPKVKMLPACLILLLISALLLAAVIFAIRKKQPPTPAPVRTRTSKSIVPTGETKEKPAEIDEQRKIEMTVLLRLSGEREAAKDFAGALRIWKNYRPPAELRNDSELRRNVEAQIRYLESRLQKESPDAMP